MTSQRMLPLYEAKMIHHYDHRWASYDASGDVRDVTLVEKQDPTFEPLPRYWVRESVVEQALNGRESGWLVGLRDITNSTNERTVLAAPFGVSAVGNNLPLIIEEKVNSAPLVGILSSFVLDYLARPKVAGVHLNFFIAEQLAVLPPSALHIPWVASGGTWITARVVELCYTSTSLQDFARAHNDQGPPFQWDPERRFLLRAELDAAFFHLYGVARDDVDYIMETFPIVRRKDLAAHGEYRTKRVILEVFDSMQRAIDTGAQYETLLDPPPGQGPRHRGGES